MFLNFAGSNLRLVRGPEKTVSFMDDMTAELPELVVSKGMMRGDYATFGISVETYGDYDVVLASGPGDILSALEQVRPERRPVVTDELRAMTEFYMNWSPTHSFVLACFDGKANPRHPIVVSYKPHDPGVLTIPGLDGHDGRLPVPGAPVYRDFAVAFGVQGVSLPYPVRYKDTVNDQWAPSSVTGFRDNRLDGPNGDYVMPIHLIRRGYVGTGLAAALL